jgi:hypothetical protein
MTEGACVYVIGPIGDHVKVGHTGDLAFRLRQLRQEYGSGITCLFSVPVMRQRMRKVEVRAHELLKDFWHERELFAVPLEKATAAVIQAVDEFNASRTIQDVAPNKTSLSLLNVRLEPGWKRVVEQMAKEDRRSASGWVEKIIIDHLKAQGFKPDQDQEEGDAE